MSIPISQVTAIHPANATENQLTLKRISPAFVEAMRQHRANRKDQSRADDYREHFRSRRSPPRHRDRDDDRFECRSGRRAGLRQRPEGVSHSGR